MSLLALYFSTVHPPGSVLLGHSGLKHHLYTQLSPYYLMSVTEFNLESHKNGLMLNTSETEYLISGSLQQLNKFNSLKSVHLGNIDIQCSSSDNLSVFLTPTCNSVNTEGNSSLHLKSHTVLLKLFAFANGFLISGHNFYRCLVTVSYCVLQTICVCTVLISELHCYLNWNTVPN